MKNIIILLLLTLLIGCNNTSENDSGKFNSIETEKNLKQSLQTYLDLKLNNQIVESSKYMHPISWQIIKLKFPDVTNLSSLKQKFDSMYVKFSIAKMNKEYNISYKVGNIIDTISFNNEKIYILAYERIGQNKFNKIYEKTITVAITNKDSLAWQFIGIYEEYIPQTKLFFSNIYPPIIVERVFHSIGFGLNNTQPNNVANFSPTSRDEKKLQIDFTNYTNAIYARNSNVILSYLYEDLFEYLKESNKNKYSLNEIKNIAVESILAKSNSNKRNVSININKILKKVEFKNNKIWAMGYSLNSNNPNDLISVGGEAIAISKNNGLNWKFFEKNNKSVIPILAKSFPNEMITELLSYEYKK